MAATTQNAARLPSAAASARNERRFRTLTRTVLLAGNRRAALRLVVARACAAAEADLGAVFIRDTDGDDVVVSAANRWSIGRLSALRPSSALAAQLLANAAPRPALLNISDDRHARGLPPAFRHLGPAMVSRVGSSGHSRGVLLIAKRASARPYTESDLRLLAPYATEAALALTFAEARRELERGLLVKDRNRIARELHDGAIQSLYGIGMVLEGIGSDPDPAAIQDQLTGITASINLVIDDLRAYISDLTPTRLAKRGLGPELCSLAQEFQTSSGVVASVRLQDGVDEIKADLGRDLMQIAREALSNVAKHAAASRVVLSLRCTAWSVRLEIVDDGHGITRKETRGGQGLANIFRRAQAWGGTAEIDSSNGSGTAVRVSVPTDGSQTRGPGQADRSRVRSAVLAIGG